MGFGVEAQDLGVWRVEALGDGSFILELDEIDLK